MQSKHFSDWVAEQKLVAAADALSSNERPVSHQLLQYWLANGVPPKHVLRVSEVSGLSPSQIRPDIYPETLKTA